MSDLSTTASPQGGAPKVSKVSEAVIRIAGNSQDGIQAIGGFLARLAGRSEQEVMTFMTIPSTISGGPSIFQVRIGSGEVLSSGDEADVLLAFYQHSYEEHLTSLRKGGIVLYDTDHVEPKPEFQKDYHHVGIPISSLTIEAIGGTAKDKGKNIFALGLLAKMFDLTVPKLEALDQRTLHRQGRKHREQRAGGVSRGLQLFRWAELIETFQFVESQQRDRKQVVMNGNEALAYGLIAAGRALWRRLPDHAVVGRHGDPAARAAQVRRQLRPVRGRDRLDLDGHWRQLRRPRGGDRFQRARASRSRSEALGWARHGRDAAGGASTSSAAVPPPACRPTSSSRT